jgi:hypothetical protein
MCQLCPYKKTILLNNQVTILNCKTNEEGL